MGSPYAREGRQLCRQLCQLAIYDIWISYNRNLVNIASLIADPCWIDWKGDLYELRGAENVNRQIESTNLGVSHSNTISGLVEFGLNSLLAIRHSWTTVSAPLALFMYMVCITRTVKSKYSQRVPNFSSARKVPVLAALDHIRAIQTWFTIWLAAGALLTHFLDRF